MQNSQMAALGFVTSSKPAIRLLTLPNGGVMIRPTKANTTTPQADRPERITK
jgi:hypothetical protein